MQHQLRCLTTAVTTCFLVVSGCSKLSTEYGKSSGTSAHASINGFGTFRSAFENAGFKDRDMGRLTNRLMNSTDVVVWTPQNDVPLNASAVLWLETWLARGKHTLIYISADSGSDEEYWTSAARMAPPKQRLEYRRRAAKSSNERMIARMSSSQSIQYPWFTVQPLPLPEQASNAKGEWKLFQGNASDQATTLIEDSLGTGTQQLPRDDDIGLAKRMTGPKPPKKSKEEYQYRSLLETANGSSYVGEVTSKRWSGSRIIVVSSGSLLTNFGLTQRPNQQLADKIIQQATPKKQSTPQVGFLTTSNSPVIVSSDQQGVPKTSGMELLTVWPISLLTMHGIFLGLVICLMLLPIFGRPRRISNNQRGNFGDHLDAVAALMKRAGGENYARSKISDYMKRMRGETSGPWVIHESPRSPKPLHTLQSSRLTQNSSKTSGNGNQPNPVTQGAGFNTPVSQGPSANPTEPAKSKHDGTET